MCDVCNLPIKVVHLKNKSICYPCIYKYYCILCLRHVNICGIRDHYICKACSILEDED